MTDRIAELRALLNARDEAARYRGKVVDTAQNFLDASLAFCMELALSGEALLDCATALRELAPDHPALKGLEND